MMNPNVTAKICTRCGARYEPGSPHLVCEECGWDGTLDFEYDYERAAVQLRAELDSPTRRGVLRYHPVLPLPEGFPDTGHTVGPSPLLEPRYLRDHVGVSRLWVKFDGQLPTASFKDRASIVAICDAKARGKTTMLAASTGNAASSLAGLAAPEGITVVIVVPKAIPRAKLAQLLTFGARVFRVDGTYDDAFDLSLKAYGRFGWYLRSTGVNPVLSEGKKTGAMELLEQLNFNPPDWIVVPVGDGCILGGMGKGLYDLEQMGFISRMPRLLGVQAQGSSVIYEAWRSGADSVTPRSATTFADSISVDLPRDWRKAIRAIERTGGRMITVSDDAIADAALLLGRLAGVFAEPAASASLAGLLEARAQGVIGPDETVALMVTGNGLKDVDGTSRRAGQAPLVPPTADGLEEISRLLKE